MEFTYRTKEGYGTTKISYLSSFYIKTTNMIIRNQPIKLLYNIPFISHDDIKNNTTTWKSNQFTYKTCEYCIMDFECRDPYRFAQICKQEFQNRQITTGILFNKTQVRLIINMKNYDASFNQGRDVRNYICNILKPKYPDFKARKCHKPGYDHQPFLDATLWDVCGNALDMKTIDRKSLSIIDIQELIDDKTIQELRKQLTQYLPENIKMIMEKLGYKQNILDHQKYEKDGDILRINPNKPKMIFSEYYGHDINLFPVLKDYVVNNINTKLTGENVINMNVKTIPENVINVDQWIHSEKSLILNSYMGSGKSNLIQNFISKAKKYKKNILCITHRTSVADEFVSKYHLNDYREKKTSAKNLVCQFDSLHKFNVDNYDLVIMDEFTSLMLYSTSPAVQIKSIWNENLLKFNKLLCKKLICADAFITDDLVNILPKKNNEFIILNNHYLDPVPVIENPENDINRILFIKASESRTITISCASKNKLYNLYDELNTVIECLIYTGDIDENQKKHALQNLEIPTNNMVLLYTSAITVGLSLLKPAYHFHFDNAFTLDVISSIQMLRRSRKTYGIFLCSGNRVVCNKNKKTAQDIIDLSINCLLQLNRETLDVELSEYGNKFLKIMNYKAELDYNYKHTLTQFLKKNFKNSKTLIHNSCSVQNVSDENKYRIKQECKRK